MGSRKRDGSAEIFRIDYYGKTITLWPLFGLERLVKIERRKQNGVLLCDSVLTMATALTFSKSNKRTERYTAEFFAAAPTFLGEPRVNAPNEAREELMRQFYDDGRAFTFAFTPQNGHTYLIACDLYRPFEIRYGGTRLRLDNTARMKHYELTLDLSAYVRAGYPIETPQCEFDAAATGDVRGDGRQTFGRRLVPRQPRPGTWQWSLDNVRGGTLDLRWLMFDRDPTQVARPAILEKLASELSIDPHVAKDLHNFVSICHYFAADFRSLSTIAHKMVAGKTVLLRSLESIERLVGEELIERTKGKGLIRITPIGEAVLEWWSRFYTRWIPISPDVARAK